MPIRQIDQGPHAHVVPGAVIMTIPAVACGGQISPYINNPVAREKMKAFLSVVFMFVGFLLLWRALGLAQK